MKSFLSKVKGRGEAGKGAAALLGDMREVVEAFCGDRARVDVQAGGDDSFIVVLEVDATQGAALETMRRDVEVLVRAMGGVKGVQVILTAERKPEQNSVSVSSRPTGLLVNVKHVVLVASGKGGVGKSTVSALLAVALSKSGRSVGLLDADIYGPSVPRMTGLAGRKPEGGQGRIVPLEVQGLKVMSVGFMVDEKAALVWRGPIVQKALMQMLGDVEWGSAENPLDILVVDMPPGTGDVQLTLAQKVKVDGAVIVSTPQDIALIDARKGVEMFGKVGVPILGVIENMSTHICSQCGHEEHIFGHGGARAEAEVLGVPFLGEIPLSAAIRQRSDAGDIFGDDPIFEEIAQKVLAFLGKQV
jgi:ATP-binding protein involved in chromosome partitioning